MQAEEEKNIGHQILDAESELGARPAHHETLDFLLSGTQKQFNSISGTQEQSEPQGEYSREEAIGLFNVVVSVLEEDGFTYGKTDSLTGALASKKLSGDALTFVYASIAEAMGVPIDIVYRPGEPSLVRCDPQEGESFHWETAAQGSLGALKDPEVIMGVDKASVLYHGYGIAADKSQMLGLAHHRIAITLRERGQDEKAIHHHNEAIKLLPTIPDLLNSKGHTLSKMGYYDDAIAEFSKAIEVDPKNPLLYSNRATAHSRKREHDKAISDYKIAIPLIQERLSVLEEAIEHDAGTLSSKSIQEQLVNCRDTFARILHAEGLTLGIMGQYNAAIKVYKQALKHLDAIKKLNPSFPSLEENISGVVKEIGLVKDAKIKSYRNELRADPDNLVVRNNLAWNLYGAGKYKEAMEQYAELLVKDPDHELAPANLRKAADKFMKTVRRLPTIEERNAAYVKIATCDPTNASAQYNAGFTYSKIEREGWELRNLNEAAGHLREAVRLESKKLYQTQLKRVEARIEALKEEARRAIQ
jgi:tetratricopeptide (TPR) repeat protein